MGFFYNQKAAGHRSHSILDFISRFRFNLSQQKRSGWQAATTKTSKQTETAGAGVGVG